MAEINLKHKLFADEFIKSGNATTAYKKIYNCSDRVANINGSKLLTNTSIQEYIKDRNAELKNDKIADMQEVREFWTEMQRNKSREPRDRLKASEYIAKTNGAFIENHNITGSILVEIVDDLEDDEDVEDED